jgi:hypothetical protein
MTSSPFKYGTTVSSLSFTNRENEVSKLYSNLTQGINTTIISPRRWGKSSLVEKVMKEVRKKEKSFKTVSIDLFTVSSEEAFLELFAREVIKASSNKWQDWLMAGKEFFKQIVPTISVGMDPSSDFSLSFDWNEIKKHKNEILNLPETIAQQKNMNFIICLDEFQNMASFPNYEELEKKMRAIWQRQKSVCYCLYGSKRHMMAEIFNSSSKPFYRFGDIILLGKIKRESWVKFIVNGFKRSGKKIAKKDAEKLAQLMKDHSWYTQQLAHYTWQNTDDQASIKNIELSLIELINANSPLYQKEVEILSNTQLNLLKAMAKGEKKLMSSKVMQKYKLGTPRNVSKNRDLLINNDIVYKENDDFLFLDPAFEIWFLKQFFSVDIRL